MTDDPLEAFQAAENPDRQALTPEHLKRILEPKPTPDFYLLLPEHVIEEIREQGLLSEDIELLTPEVSDEG